MSSTVWYISKYVTPTYAARVGSRGFHLLRAFAQLGHDPVLITSDSNHLATPPTFQGPSMEEDVDGVRVVWLRTKKYAGVRSLFRVLSWFDFEYRIWRARRLQLPRPDVVIVSSLSLLTVLNGLLLRRRYGCALVFEVRDIWPMMLVETGGVHPWHPLVLLLSWIEKLGYRRADLVVGTMPNLVEHVVEQVGHGPEVLCVPQGVDPVLNEPAEALPGAYREAHVPRDKFVVCHAGSIGADNALETLLDCAREMQDSGDVHFLLVGDGDLKADLESRYSDLPNVTFAPGIPKRQVPSLLAEADVLYFAAHASPLARYGQSLNKLVDYMMAAKPVIGSFGGYPSMVNEADCGVFVPPEDAVALRAAIERMASLSEEDRKAMGDRGRAWLDEHRQYPILGKFYMDHLRPVIERRSGRGAA